MKLFNIEVGMFNYQEYVIVLQFNNAQAISPILEILFWRLSKIYSCYCDGRMFLIYNEDKTLNQLQYISADFMDLKKVYTIILNYVVKYGELKTTWLCKLLCGCPLNFIEHRQLIKIQLH